MSHIIDIETLASDNKAIII